MWGMTSTDDQGGTTPAAESTPPAPKPAPKPAAPALPKEVGGPKGPEPTRYGDWEQKGRATDF
jgi:hypothetical protein